MLRIANSIGHPISFGSCVEGESKYTLRLPQKITPTVVAAMVRPLGHPISADTCARLDVGSSEPKSPCHIHVDTGVKIARGAVGTATADVCGTGTIPVTASPRSRVNACAGKNSPWSRTCCSNPGTSTEVHHTRLAAGPVPPAP